MATSSHEEQAALLGSKSAPSPAYSTLRHLRRRDDGPSRSLDDQVIPETSPLGRTLTWSSAYVLTISRVLGTGIFATPGSILKAVGSPGISLLVWLFGGIVAACGLAYSLEYGCMLPRSGGFKVWLEFTYQRPRLLASVLVAIQVLLLSYTAPNCIVFGQYVVFALGIQDDGRGYVQWLERCLALALHTFVTGMHTVTPRVGVRIQNVVGFFKVGIIVLMFLSGVYAVCGGLQQQPQPPTSPPPPPSSGQQVRGAPASQLSWDVLWKDSIWSWGVISKALFEVSYAYSGLDALTGVMNEVKDPIRTLRSVAVTALLTSCVMYTFINVAYFLVVPIEEIRGSGELVAALFFERVFGNSIGRTVLPLVVAFSAAGNVAVATFTTARVKQEIARQGLLPFSQALSSTKPFGSPIGGLLLHWVPTFLVIAVLPAGELYTFVLHVESYVGQLASIAIGLGLIWLRYEKPDLKRPFRAWLPAVTMRNLLSFFLLLAPFFPSKEEKAGGMFYAAYAVVGMAVALGGVSYWYVWTVLLPKLGGYRLDEHVMVLDDGTTITKFIHKQL